MVILKKFVLSYYLHIVTYFFLDLDCLLIGLK